MHLRFGLRTLLIVFSLLCVLLGMLGRWWLEDRRQQALVDQCEKMLVSEGQVGLSRDDQQNVGIEFYGKLSPATARALCVARYVRILSINSLNDTLSAEAAAVLREGFVQADPPNTGADLWARPGDAGFIRFVEDRGGKVPEMEPPPGK